MFPAIAIPKFDKARNIPLQPPKIQPGLPFCGQSRFRALTKYRKNEAFIRNDGVYVISGIFCGAHEARALWAKQREVSPVSNESCKRACERLRPEGLKWRAHGAKRSAQRQPLSRLTPTASSIQHGRSAALTSLLAVLPASLGLLRAAPPTGRALRAPPCTGEPLGDTPPRVFIATG